MIYNFLFAIVTITYNKIIQITPLTRFFRAPVKLLNQPYPKQDTAESIQPLNQYPVYCHSRASQQLSRFFMPILLQYDAPDYLLRELVQPV